ncbi:MAG: aminotransferase class I/II-fold pyridoxal phosphate-dependent enzyme [Planctomycetota bacterium]
MDFASKRIRSTGAYAFAEVDRLVAELRAKGIAPIDFGVGDPVIPTPRFVREACKRGVDKRASAGYPSYIGSGEFRKAVAAWTRRRFGVTLDPATEVTATIGSKEAVFNFHEAVVDPGDVVLVPSPGYPPYSRGTRFAEGIPWFYPVCSENGFLPEFGKFPKGVLRRAKVLWINYPNSPSGRVAPKAFLKEAVRFAARHGMILASDEAYSEIYFTREKPHSALEYGRKGVIVFHSFSKRSAMTCYRVGWAAGDADLVGLFRKVKTNIDSGTPTFIQDAAVAALSDEKHVAAMRSEYREKRDILVRAFTAAGLPDCTPEGTLYIWQRVPSGMTSAAYAKRLLAPDIAVVATPGSWIAEPLADGTNPGEGFVRFALVPGLADTREAARRIGRLYLA